MRVNDVVTDRVDFAVPVLVIERLSDCDCEALSEGVPDAASVLVGVADGLLPGDSRIDGDEEVVRVESDVDVVEAIGDAVSVAIGVGEGDRDSVIDSEVVTEGVPVPVGVFVSEAVTDATAEAVTVDVGVCVVVVDTDTVVDSVADAEVVGNIG